jgi:L-lactate utilization protein LutB
MIKIQFVLSNTEASFGVTGSPINAAAVNSTWNEEYAESISVVCGAVCYTCEDGSCVVVTPKGITRLADLWPTTDVAVTEVANIPPVVEEVPTQETP